MNKNEFVAAVHDHKAVRNIDLSKNTVTVLIEAALETIELALQKGDEVRLVGFGNFYVAKRDASTGRNPRTGEKIAIKAIRQPRFRAGKQLKDRVNTARK